MKKILSVVLAVSASVTMANAAVQQTSATVNCGTSKTITATPKTGYHFVEWNDGNTNASRTVEVNATITYTATFAPNTNTAYTVKHYQQNLNNDEYTEVTGDRENKTGTTGALTAAVAKSYTGFTAESFSQTTIAANGSAVVEIYYTRNKYTVTFKNGETTLQTIENVKYGATPTYSGAAPTKPEDASYRYEFSGWSPALGAITGNTIYIAQFNAIPKTFYTITTAVDPDAGVGTVTGGGSYESGSEVTLTATSDDACYVFDHWKEDNNTNASRTITISGNATYTAVFKQLQYTITIQSEDDTMGTVSAE